VTARSGILLVDKPGGLTSHDVVARTRKIASTRKVGHAGTLDPMATGLLVLGINSSTRLLTFLVGLDKEYRATIRLGESTTTDDAEGSVIASVGTAAVSDESILAGIARLTGPISQVPSSFSAIKVDGKRAYDLARAGQSVELKSRGVTVSAFELEGVARGEHLDLEVRIECSSGTYVRALARDLGDALGVGGHLTALRRTRIGPFRIEDASELTNLDVDDALLSPAVVAEALFPIVRLDAAQVVDLTHGKRIQIADQPRGPVAAIAPEGRLVGLVEVKDGLARPIVNFPTDEVLE
jgi:tRNA pseudouridine55 synthase